MIKVVLPLFFLFNITELSDSVAMSPADRMRALSLKLVSLGKLYAGTPRYFPLGTISPSTQCLWRLLLHFDIYNLFVSLDAFYACLDMPAFPAGFSYAIPKHSWKLTVAI